MQKEILVPVEWFERLQEHVDRAEKAHYPKEVEQALVKLLGYCSSVKTILKIYK